MFTIILYKVILILNDRHKNRLMLYKKPYIYHRKLRLAFLL